MTGHPVALLALAAGLTAAATWMARGTARAIGFLDRPNPIIPQHTRPIAYGGGVALVLGAVTALAVAPALGLGESLAAMARSPPLLALWLPALLFLILGLYDDARRPPPVPKLLLQAGVAGLAVSLGLGADWTGVAMLDAALSGLVILTGVNAANLTDVCDGLLAGLGAVGLAGLGLLLAPALPHHAVLAWTFAGACLGFLAFNRPPASIFLGDAGSHLLGFLLAALGLELVAGSPRPWLATAQAGLLAAVPLFELVFLTVVRIAKGLPWWRGSADHLSLRLQAAGFSRLRTDLLAWSAALLGALAALALPWLPRIGQVATLALVVTAALAAGLWLKLHEVPPKGEVTLPSASNRPP